MATAVDEEEAAGTTTGESVLECITRMGPTSATVVAAELGKQTGNVGTRFRQLEEEGRVRRTGRSVPGGRGGPQVEWEVMPEGGERTGPEAPAELPPGSLEIERDRVRRLTRRIEELSESVERAENVAEATRTRAEEADRQRTEAQRRFESQREASARLEAQLAEVREDRDRLLEEAEKAEDVPPGVAQRLETLQAERDMAREEHAQAILEVERLRADVDANARAADEAATRARAAEHAFERVDAAEREAAELRDSLAAEQFRATHLEETLRSTEVALKVSAGEVLERTLEAEELMQARDEALADAARSGEPARQELREVAHMLGVGPDPEAGVIPRRLREVLDEEYPDHPSGRWTPEAAGAVSDLRVRLFDELLEHVRRGQATEDVLDRLERLAEGPAA